MKEYFAIIRFYSFLNLGQNTNSVIIKIYQMLKNSLAIASLLVSSTKASSLDSRHTQNLQELSELFDQNYEDPDPIELYDDRSYAEEDVGGVTENCTAGIVRFTNGTSNSWTAFKNAQSADAKW